MKAEIITTGTELLLGEITDANTPFIAGHLAMLGIDLFYTSTVGDNYERLLGVLRQAWQRSDILIVTGGLGPTQGDITREVIGTLVGERPTVDDGLKQNLVDFFARLGTEMPENNIKQAALIPSAAAMPNRQGTAPGWWVEKDGRIVIALPGPPREMQTMWQSEVLPRLKKRTKAIILSRTMKTRGLSEAKVDDLVSPFLSVASPTLAIYAKLDGIHLRITAKASTRAIASKMISERENDIREILKDYIWGTDNDTLESVTGRLLRSKKLTLAVAESFTGGALSHSLASTPEMSGYFKGGFIAATDEAKAVLELKAELSGKASIEAAESMASLVRAKFVADIGIGIDGYAGADGSIVPGAAFIFIDAGKSAKKVAKTYRARPQQLIRMTTNQALFNLRTLLLSLQ